MVDDAESLECKQAPAQLFEHLDRVLRLEAHVLLVGLQVAFHQLLSNHGVVGVLQRADHADQALALLDLAAGPESSAEQFERFDVEEFVQHLERGRLLIVHARIHQAP